MSDNRVQDFIDRFNAERGRPPEGWEDDEGDDGEEDEGQGDPFARHAPSDPLKGRKKRG